MSDLNVPLANPAPDCGRFVRTLMGQEKSARPPLIEYLVDDMLRQPITEMIGREWVSPGADREIPGRLLGQLHRLLAAHGL